MVAPRRRWARVVHAVVSVLMAIGTLLGGPIGEAVASPVRVTLDATATTTPTVTEAPSRGSVRARATVIWAQLSAGASHTCGVTIDGTGYCWGSNQYGQLGDGTKTDRFTPVLVSGGYIWQSISAGFNHSCGTSSSGKHYCWGNNDVGQLGNGSFLNSNTPKEILNSQDFIFVKTSSRNSNACGVTRSALYCWGTNESGIVSNPYSYGGVYPYYYCATPVNSCDPTPRPGLVRLGKIDVAPIPLLSSIPVTSTNPDSLLLFYNTVCLNFYCTGFYNNAGPPVAAY